MNKTNFMIGMGMGLMVGMGAGMMVRPKKSSMSCMIGRTLKAMGEVADSISDTLGWYPAQK